MLLAGNWPVCLLAVLLTFKSTHARSLPSSFPPVSILDDCSNVTNHFLPHQVNRVQYFLTFHANFMRHERQNDSWIKLDQPHYYVRVEVEFALVEQATNWIRLHVGTYSTYQLLHATAHSLEREIRIVRLVRCSQHMVMTIFFSRVIQPNEMVRLSFGVWGNVTTPPFDLDFRNKEARLVLISEPFHLRQAFPCFDEPQIRAHWTVKIIRPSHVFSLSNQVEKSTVNHTDCLHSDGRDFISNELLQQLHCDIYPPSDYAMSTYLFTLFLATSGIARETMPLSNNRTLEVYFNVMENSPQNASMFLNLTKTYVEFYEDYFNFTFPGKNIQSVVVDLSFGEGEETWNIIAYKRLYLGKDTRRIIAHEVVHHWLGNLVNIDSFQYLWLKESTTEMIAQQFDNDSPEMLALYTMNQILSTYVYTLGDLPIEFSIENRKQIDNLFSWRVYIKGTHILSIVQNSLLESYTSMRDVFRKVVHQHHGSTLTQDVFWSYLDTAGAQVRPRLQLNLSELVRPYFTQVYLPLVHVHFVPIGLVLQAPSEEEGQDATSQPQMVQLYQAELSFEIFRPHPRVRVGNNPWKKLLVQLVSEEFPDPIPVWIGQNETVRVERNFTNLSAVITANKDYAVGVYVTHYDANVYSTLMKLRTTPELNRTFASYLGIQVMEMASVMLSGYETNISFIVDMYLWNLETQSSGFNLMQLYFFVTSSNQSQRLENYILQKKNFNPEVIGNSDFTNREIYITTPTKKPSNRSISELTVGCGNIKSVDLRYMRQLVSLFVYQMNVTERTQFLRCFLESSSQNDSNSLNYSQFQRDSLLNDTFINNLKNISQEGWNLVDDVSNITNDSRSDDWSMQMGLLGDNGLQLLMKLLTINLHSSVALSEALDNLLLPNGSATVENLYHSENIALFEAVMQRTSRFIISQHLCTLAELIYEDLAVMPQFQYNPTYFNTDGRNSTTLLQDRDVFVLAKYVEPVLQPCNLRQKLGEKLNDWLTENGF